MGTKWPHNKKFAFTIVDDTEGGTVSNLKPIYDLFYDKGLKTTKTVWVYPPRDKFTGESLADRVYYDFISELDERGFEIALHNVGSGDFSREEIRSGLKLFNQTMGFYPIMQINHASNLDNLYWGIERYTKILQYIMTLLYGSRRKYYGTDPSSKYFWGDMSKRYIKYIRNHTFNGINTLKYDPKMPYKVSDKEAYSNYWFSSSDGDTVDEFTELISPRNVLKLEKENGLCIVYTHLAKGFVDKNGQINSRFKSHIDFLSQREGWFVPAGEILEFLNKASPERYASQSYLFKLDVRWAFERIWKKIKYGR